MPEHSREFDIIVFGATGVTGRYAAEQVYKASQEEGFKWAVAGRNESKLNTSLEEVAGWLKMIDVKAFAKSVPKVIADVSDIDSLRKMAKRCTIVVNTVGPYRFYGEAVIAACVEEGTNHVDVSGEPEFIETMQFKFHEKAKEKNIFVLSACGFDSIPCEMITTYTKQQFRGRLNELETFISTKTPPGSKVNTGTWESAVHGVGNRSGLVALRKQIMDTMFTKKIEEPRFKQEKRSLLSTTDFFGGYTLPFPGSDRSVVMKSELLRHENQDGYKPVQLETYFRVPGLIHAFVLMTAATLFFIMTRFECGRNLLIKHPSLFSLGLFAKEGPKRHMTEASSMRTTAYGKGWHTGDDESQPPKQEILTQFDGPDPGYIGTSIMLVTSAICILKDRAAMPFGGGCISPGFALEKTSYLERIQKKGFKLSVLRQS